MTDPMTITTATLIALAASQFVQSAAKKAGEVVSSAALEQGGGQIGQLWGRIKQHFVGDKRAEKAIAQVEQERSEVALTKLEGYLQDDLAEPENQALAAELRQMAQQIINIGEQRQKTITFNVNAQDESQPISIAELNDNKGTINIGNRHP